MLKGASFTLVIQVLAVALGFGSQVLLARWMGPFEFGIYAFAWSLVPSAAIVVAIGLPGAAIRFIPQYLSQNMPERVHGLIRRGIMLTLAVGVATCLLGGVVLWLVDPWLDDFYNFPALMGLLCVPALALVILLSGMSRGFSWVALAFIPQMLMVPALLIVGVLVYTFAVDMPTAAVVLQTLLGACILTALLHLLFFRRAVNRQIDKATPSYETRTWLQVAIPLLLSEGVLVFLWSCDEVMLGGMTTPQDVSIYHASMKTAGLTLVLFNAVSAMTAPRFSALWLEKDKDELGHFARSIARWMFAPTLLVVIGLAVVGPFVLKVFGQSFTAGYSVLIVLALGYLVKSAIGPVDAYLAVTGHQNSIVIVTGCVAVLNIVLNLALIPRYGYLGAGIASAIAVVVFQLWHYVLVYKRLGINSFILARR